MGEDYRKRIGRSGGEQKKKKGQAGSGDRECRRRSKKMKYALGCVYANEGKGKREMVYKWSFKSGTNRSSDGLPLRSTGLLFKKNP